MKRILAVCAVFVMAVTAVPFTALAIEPAEVVWVGDGTKEHNYATIQEAVDAVAGGGAVHVAAGEYVEQVVINKSLSLIGEEGAVVKAPATPEAFTVPEDSKKWEPVIFIFGGTRSGNAVTGEEQVNVHISGLTIDGDARKPAGRAAGILLRNVTGTVSGNILRNFDLNTETFGVLVNGNSDVVIRENDISGFGRGGIVAGSYGTVSCSNASIRNNKVATITHAKWAQNGIQIGWGATGEIIGNTVTGHVWADGRWGASGILIPGSSNIAIAGNTVCNNDYGICVAGYGNYGGHHPSSNISIRDNTLSGNTYSGICLQGDVSDTIIEGNAIHFNANGIDIYDYNPGDWTGGGVPVRNKATGNKFWDNEKAIVVWPLYPENEPAPEGYTFNADGNWWGSADEPTSFEGDVAFTTWALDEDFTSFASRVSVVDAFEPVELQAAVNHVKIDTADINDDDVLILKKDEMELNFPAALLPAGEVEMVISQRDAGTAPAGFKFLGSVFSFTMVADGEPVTEFDGVVAIVFTYNPAEVGDPENLDVYWFDGEEWIPQHGILDEVNHTVTVEVDHWSDFALMEAEAEEDEDIKELPQTGTCVTWLLPLGFMLLLAGAMMLRRKEVA